MFASRAVRVAVSLALVAAVTTILWRIKLAVGGSHQFVCTPLKRDGEPCSFSPAYDNHCLEADSVCFRDVCQRNGPAQCSAPPVLP